MADGRARDRRASPIRSARSSTSGRWRAGSSCEGAGAARGRRRRLRGAPERDDRLRGADASRAATRSSCAARATPSAPTAALAAIVREARGRGGAARGRGRAARRRRPRASSRSWRPQEGLVDLLIPRGGEGLKEALKEVATVPVMYAAAGNCHVYVHADADLEMARRIAFNAKVAAARGLQRGRDAAGRRGGRRPSSCPASSPISTRPGSSWSATSAPARPAGEVAVGEATEEDWDTEYLGLKMAVGVVDSLEEAIEHVNAHGTGHSEAIVTGSERRRPRVHRRGRRGGRLRQRVDPLHRRLRVRDGRRDRQLDPEAARARADRAARADHVQVRRPRRRPGPWVATAGRRGRRSRGRVQPAAPRAPGARPGGGVPARPRRGAAGADRARRRTSGSSREPGREVRLEMTRLAAADGSGVLGLGASRSSARGPSYTLSYPGVVERRSDPATSSSS